MIKQINQMQEKAINLSNFERFKRMFFKLDINSYVIHNHIEKCIVEKTSLSKRIMYDTIFTNDENFKLYEAGEGLHLCKFESCWGILEMVMPQKSGDLTKLAVYTLPWNKDKILSEFESVLPVYKNHSRLEIRNKKIHRVLPLNPEYGNREQFVTEEIYNTVDDVFQSMMEGDDKYISVGKPFKETILLYGPPGTGKSTLVRHFAAKYNLNLTKCDPDMVLDIDVHGRQKNKPEIILIEDFDSAEFLCIEKSIKITDTEIDYSDFINWLDGVQPLKNVIIFLTTNCIEKIIQSVIRGGRVNRKIFMPPLTTEQLCQFFDEKWHDKIMTYENGAITIAMIPDLRNAKDNDDFDHIVKILS